MKITNVFLLFMLGSALFFTPLVAAEKGSENHAHKALQGTLWMQTSAEYRATTTTIYHAAMDKLALALRDPEWTAASEQTGNFGDLPPAVILDVDETVLDNSPYAARNIRDDEGFDLDTWNKWCKDAVAEPIAGAIEFTNFAAQNGVAVFYVTNREHKVEGATLRNLQEKGFPLLLGADSLLTKGEKPEWDSMKVARRQHVAANYRVLFLFGDDFNDFAPVRNMSKDERFKLAKESSAKWGTRWFLLPNPTYGSWERPLRNSPVLDHLNTAE